MPIKFLLLAIPLVESVKKPVSNELKSRSTEKTNCTCSRSESACPGHCEDGWAYYSRTDACYKVFYWEEFDAAESICKIEGGHLASIHSFEENEFVTDLAKTGVNGDSFLKGTWIGLKQANYPHSKEWTWTDGTQVGFIPWSPGQPDGEYQHCAQVFCDYMVDDRYVYQRWNDVDCSAKMRTFMCKKKALH